MSKHIETYGPKQLQRYLEGLGAARRDNGSGHLFYVMPDGVEVPCPGHGQIVTTLMAETAAKRLGMTRRDLTAAVKGAEIAKTGKIRKGVAPNKGGAASRVDVLHALDALASLVGDIRRTARGQRDPSHYRRQLSAVSRAHAELEKSP